MKLILEKRVVVWELEKELARVQDPVVVDRCRRRQLEKREVLGSK